MSVFNDLSKKAQAAASTATDLAKYWTETAKINVAIAGEQKEIDKNCLAIGQWFVNDYEGEIPEAVKDLVDLVNASKSKIAELEENRPSKPAPTEPTTEDGPDEEDEAKPEAEPAGKPCPICGKVSDSKFCPHCGAPMGDEEA